MKLSLSQIEDSFELEDHSEWLSEIGEEVDELQPLTRDLDESCYRTTYQRKEIRTKKKRDDGELVGSGNVRKHRKY